MKRIAFTVVFICIMSGIQGLFAQEAFSWHLALVKDEQGLPFDEPVNMNNGEKFSIQLYSDKDCYAYIVVEQASGSMLTLMSRRIRAGMLESTGDLAFAAESTGQEKIHVVTSSAEQKLLQRAIDAYKIDPNSNNTNALQTALSESKDDKPGRRSGFGGSVRGETIQGTVYSGFSAYKKTIVISH